MEVEISTRVRKTIAIIDYGLGNIHSVAGGIERLGHTPLVTNRIKEMESADRLILPGVGAFPDGMKNLEGLDLVEPLTELVIEQKKPIIGICLGCQLMAKESFEFGHHKGLGWINASAVKFESEDKSIRIPHVGWNDLIQVRPDVIFDGVPEDALFYYTHSYHIKCHDEKLVLGSCEYGKVFTAVFHMNNIYGTQFHPEKSQLHGLNVLRNYLEKC